MVTRSHEGAVEKDAPPTVDEFLIIEVDGQWEVWCGADGNNIINAHLIGLGHTRHAAIENASEELWRLRALLMSLQKDSGEEAAKDDATAHAPETEPRVDSGGEE